MNNIIITLHLIVLVGDIGYYNTDGYFFITGRMKELIKYNTYQVR